MFAARGVKASHSSSEARIDPDNLAPQKEGMDNPSTNHTKPDGSTEYVNGTHPEKKEEKDDKDTPV